VFGWTETGSYAEYASVPSDQLVPMPANLRFEQAAAVPISGLAALQGLRDVGEAELVRSIGADEVVDYTREDVTDGSRHWDLILDTAGHRSLSRLRRALSPAGPLVIVGSEGRGRFLGGFDRQLRAVALSRVVGHLLAGGGRGKIVITV
jgi:NADPH:quinone reductase-like Zn-dependent oxidoreductase